MGILIFLGTTVLGIIGYLIMSALVRVPGAALQTKFSKLGVLAGKSYQEIVAACGKPSSVSPTGDGGKLCQCLETGYHIALLFDTDDVCIGITHEAAV